MLRDSGHHGGGMATATFDRRGLDTAGARSYTRGGGEMVASAVFRNRHGRVRIVFRVVLFLALFAALLIPLTKVAPSDEWLRGVLPPFLEILQLGYLAAKILACCLIATWVMTRFVDRRPFRAVGMGRHAGATRDVALGLGLGAFLMSFVPACLAMAGYADIVVLPAAGSALLLGIPLLVVSTAIIGVNEEFLFRGYFFQLLIEGLGPWWAAVSLNLVFGALHYLNPNGTILGGLGTALWGLLLSYAYIKTKSLWFPMGIHWAANFIEGAVWGVPVSGHRYGVSFLVTTLSGPEIVSGGVFGPEASVLMPVGLALGLLFIHRYERLRASERMQQLWHRYVQPREPGSDELDSVRKT